MDGFVRSILLEEHNARRHLVYPSKGETKMTQHPRISALCAIAGGISCFVVCTPLALPASAAPLEVLQKDAIRKPQTKLHHFEVGDEWNYKFTYTLYEHATYLFGWTVAHKSALDVRMRVVRQEKDSPSDMALLITVKGLTQEGAKIDVAGLVWIRQDEKENLNVLKPLEPDSKNTKEATLLPGEWSDGLYFALSWVGDWVHDIFSEGVAAIREGDLFGTVGSVVIDGTEEVKTHAGKFICWTGKRVKFSTNRQPTANTWYFAPEVGLPVRSVEEYPGPTEYSARGIDSHVALTWDLESTNVLPADPKARSH